MTTPAPAAPPSWSQRAGAWSWRFLGICLAVGVIGVVADRLKVFLVAVFLGLVLTAVLRPVVRRLRGRLPVVLAVGLSLFMGALVCGALVMVVVIGISSQWEVVVRGAGEGIVDILHALRQGGVLDSVEESDVEEWTALAVSWLRANAWGLAGFAATRAGSVAVVGMVLAFAIFTSVCLLTGGDTMWSWFLAQLPSGTRDRWDAAGRAGWSFFGGYTRGAFLVATSVGLLAFVLLLVLRVPLAVPLGVLVFIGSFIPLIGAPLAMSVAILVALATNGLWSAVFVGVAIALVGQVEGNVLEPLVMGRHAHLHPFVVGAAVTIGTLVAGLVGALVAVPVTGVVWRVFDALRDPPGAPDEPTPREPAEPPSPTGAQA